MSTIGNQRAEARPLEGQTSMEYALKRQLIFIVTISLLIAGSVTGGYYLLKPKPACNDGIQNQKEEGVDCGGPCAACRVARFDDIAVLSYKSFPVGDGSYDALAEIKNPNKDHGAPELQFVFNFYNADKKLIGERSGKTFILANQTRYIIESNIQLPEPAALVDFTIKPGVSWQKQESYESDLPIFSVKYELMSQGELGFAKVTGVVENKTAYNFNSVEADVVPVDDNDQPIAVGKTILDNLRFGESRAFIVLFYDKIPTPHNIYTKAITNLLDLSNAR